LIKEKLRAVVFPENFLNATACFVDIQTPGMLVEAKFFNLKAPSGSCRRR